MESRNELSDIVLEKGGSKTVKLKRILIVAAFLILIFLVALASMKMLNKEPNKETSKLILPPEPNAQEVPMTKDDQLFKQVPIIEENPKKESFEDMIKTLKEKEALKQENAKATEQALKESDELKTPSKIEAPKNTDKPKEKEVAKPKAPPATASTPVTQTSATANAGIYIQVGAVATTPEQRVLNDIKSKGFEYRLYQTVVNGNNVTKILIGPYAKSEDAQTAMVSVRASINKNAFIYRIK